MAVERVIKRDGRIASFEKSAIESAVKKAFASAGATDDKLAKKVADEVGDEVDRIFSNENLPHVEEVQDLVERALVKGGLARQAKAFILYREERARARAAKSIVGVEDDLDIGVNAAKILSQRYLIKDEAGRVTETPVEMLRRVAKALAEVDRLYDEDPGKTEAAFFATMAAFDFLPNSPTLMNAGTPLGQLAACFVIPVEDSIAGIFDGVKWMAQIHQSGGGTGFSFSRLRPEGDIVRSTKGIASGPVSFMRVFDVATDVVKQGGRRRGANMGILRCDHPDILEFVTAKRREGMLANFNLSVAVTDEFMEKAIGGGEIELNNPRTGRSTETLQAADLFDQIVASAWETGDPGLFFIDRANQQNPTPMAGAFESTNPCGEVPLLPFESCNLGSINLANMLATAPTRAPEIDWSHLKKTVHRAVHMLDNVIDATAYPLPQIEKMTKANRKIGLGVMGFAEMLIKLGIAYDSDPAVKLAEELMSFIFEEAKGASAALAERRGPFPAFPESAWAKAGHNAMRNATVTSIAPTGSIGIIAGTSSGIEPIFAVAYSRQVTGGSTLMETNELFEETARARGFYSRELMLEIAKTGRVRNRSDIPKDLRNIFATAFDVAPEWHVRMQAAFQKHTDNAVSKTVNLPRSATLDEVRKIFLLAYESGCKGITVYRYGSKREQVLYVGAEEKDGSVPQPVTAKSEFAGGCAYDSETKTCYY